MLPLEVIDTLLALAVGVIAGGIVGLAVVLAYAAWHR